LNTSKIKIFFTILILISSINFLHGADNFFDEAKKNYEENKMKESKFLFQRNIIFNPKDSRSYLYLAKIYNFEKNQKEELKNLNSTLLLEPQNEDAMHMLIVIELKKSNYKRVKELTNNFQKICLKLCFKIKKINQLLENIEPKNES
jgi:hypothetical protein